MDRIGDLHEVRLEDYSPPPFVVDSIDLDFELASDECLVTSTLSVRRARGTPAGTPLVLDGTALEPTAVALGGRNLERDEYGLDEHRLVFPASIVEAADGDAPGLERGGAPGSGAKTGSASAASTGTSFEVTIGTRLVPRRNTTLKGLYESNGILCTQCEAEDFRRITFFPDRPDVLARYTTTVRAAQADFPVLLSNGNLVASGSLAGGRHFVRWEDPFPKPSYLFALVAGDLELVEDTFVTASGRDVTLRIYSEPHNIARCGHAMESLKRAMRWDETVYGLEYDLDLYMVVAVDHFNMGAMENKGLNVFNSRYVLADPETATDADFANVEAVIGHEYFHNWTGNRVTCRDWFQLSLKEGLTVFREQQFAADMGSRAVKRIRDARLIRDHQFKEDGGPDAHPVRPTAYREINNFYTTTVYHKGAEVIRMMHTLLGAEAFGRGMSRYLERHDGSAATTDDFVASMEDGGDIDLGQFRRWYEQAGTPILHLVEDYDSATRELTLVVRQELPATADGSPKEPVHLPLAIGLVGPDGKPLRSPAPGGAAPRADGTLVLDVRAPEETFVFRDLDARPLVSILRGFSAPVKIAMDRCDRDLLTLLAHDPDPFARWDAGQTLALARLDRLIRIGGRPGSGAPAADPTFVAGMRAVLLDRAVDPALAAEILTLPSERHLAGRMERIDVDAIHLARRTLLRALAEALEPDLTGTRRELRSSREAYRYEPDGAARRALANACLGLLASTESAPARRACLEQFETADNMTDTMAGLGLLADIDCEEREEALGSFERRWSDNPLAMDKWLAAQATSTFSGALERTTALLAHPAFDATNPNRLRALVGAFCESNPVHFHAADGSGYRFWTEQMRSIDRRIPEVAARLAGAMSQWRRFDASRQELMAAAMESVLAASQVSRNTNEVLTRLLNAPR